ncbi:hypothetical protein Gotri_007517 [Gossypium trilobum]|uniref:Expansin-like EG45 domain-containing protein n=1 Tax=Gossypium trilobum TaxID=34281 RepID=A0A7J9EGC0_9ROSI|nr:hypothetical protein [Gossypium trilobum]
MIAAAGDALWKNGAVCGKKFTVKCTGPRNGVPHPCTGKSVTVKNGEHETNMILRFRGNDCLKWKKPDQQMIKINCNASWTSESRWAAIVAVATDYTRKVVDGCSNLFN